MGVAKFRCPRCGTGTQFQYEVGQGASEERLKTKGLEQKVKSLESLIESRNRDLAVWEQIHGPLIEAMEIVACFSLLTELNDESVQSSFASLRERAVVVVGDYEAITNTRAVEVVRKGDEEAGTV